MPSRAPHTQGMLVKAVDTVYGEAGVKKEKEEYLRRVVDASTDNVPPGRLVIKQVCGNGGGGGGVRKWRWRGVCERERMYVYESACERAGE